MAKATRLTPFEQKEHERLQNEVDRAQDALVEPQQLLDRNVHRLMRYKTQMARKYRLQGDDAIDVLGNITRGGPKAKAKS